MAGYTYQLTSNPYRTTADPTFGWTRSKAWSNGRHSEVETFSGATLPAPWGANSSSTGMVQTDIDANATTYDALNRVTFRNYSDSTPDVTYTYDNKTNAYGKLTKVSSSVSTTEYTAFDILGRVTSHKQTTDGNDYTTGYTYNLSGQLLEQTYPSGRVVKNTYDPADGSISQVQSKRSSETYRNFANAFVTNAAGAVTAMRLGNGKWENTVFNSRMQPTQIGLGNGVNSQNLLKLEYSYGTTANNGNVVSQTITVPGVTHPFVQAYTHDELNRLTSAMETQNAVQTWKQQFTFDRYGNRNFDEANTTTLTKNCGTAPNFTVCTADRKIVNPSINTANNRLNTSEDYSLDSSGNTTADAEGRAFVYDAENKQVAVIESSTTIGEYFYDGDGKRVKKVVPGGETTVFVYDAGGKLIGEYSSEVQTGSDAKTVYTTNDHLGSPRINTDATGQVISRHDYHPFGEEIARTGYGSDTIRKQFTGYERDGETELDFAQARYYVKSLGRFSTTDPARESVELDAPQTWNRYIYCNNAPLTFVDKNGKWPTRIHNYIIQRAFSGLTPSQIAQIQAGSQHVDKKRDSEYGIGTLNPANAREHSQRSNPLDSVEAGQDKTDAYIRSKLNEAYQSDGSGAPSENALFAFGEASHPIEDMTSPTHKDWAVYTIPNLTLFRVDAEPRLGLSGIHIEVPNYFSTGAGLISHSIGEYAANPFFTPSDDQIQESLVRMRAAFYIAFGEDAFKEAVRDEKDRTEAIDHLKRTGAY